MDIIDPTDKTVDALMKPRPAGGSGRRDQVVRERYSSRELSIDRLSRRRPTASRHPGQKAKNMSLGLVGRKVGMTRVFTDDGDSHPGDGRGRVEQPRHRRSRPPRTDGYCAVQVAFGKRCAEPRQQGRGRPFREGRRRSRPRPARSSACRPSALGDLKLRAARSAWTSSRWAQKVDVSGVSRRARASPA